MQAFYKVEYLFEVHENCFTPPPKVKSGVLRFTNTHNPHNITDKKKFISIVKTAFNQRRKTLRNALKSMAPADLLLHPIMDKRAEQLSVNDFAWLYNEFINGKYL
jgi:16S rRNA (adenine1518-N6/adenine1519-N6)-dimethyltransferase